MALLQRLFILLAALASGSAAPPQTNWDAVTPDLSQSFRGLRPGPLALSELLERRDLGLSTSYGLEQLSASASRALLA